MAQDHNDIYSIVERLAILEGRITPASVKHGLNKQQKSVPQLPALFKPKTEKILGGNPDAKNPMSGYMVGDDVEDNREPVEEAVANEDVLEKVKSSFDDYLKSIEEKYKDADLKDKKKGDTDLKNKDKRDRDLIAKEAAPTQTEIVPTVTSSSQDEEPGLDPEIVPELEESHQKLQVGDRVMVTGPNHYEGEFAEIAEFSPSGKFVVVKFDNGDEASMHLSDVEFHDDQEDVEDWEDDIVESGPVKTVTNECGLWEIHGNEPTGFEIRHGNNAMKSKFKTIEEAEIALEMFAARRRKADESADYIEEA